MKCPAFFKADCFAYGSAAVEILDAVYPQPSQEHIFLCGTLGLVGLAAGASPKYMTNDRVTSLFFGLAAAEMVVALHPDAPSRGLMIGAASALAGIGYRMLQKYAPD